MKAETFRYGVCYYVDCLDKEYGLPSRKDKEFDLGFTDSPWGVDQHKRVDNKRNYYGSVLEVKNNKKYYDDKFDPDWNLEWFSELRRVTKSTILVIPESKKYWWIRNTDPIGDITIQWNNGYSGSKVAKFSRKSTYLVYGKLPQKLQYDLIPEKTLIWGFLSSWKGKHPNRKGIEIPLQILKEIQPKKVIDPFLGSGSYAQACELLKISWLGYEIMEEYREDLILSMENTANNKTSVLYWLDKNKEEKI